jgi:hypothetical protein
MANVYKDSKRPLERELPDNAHRRLPDGGLLMKDGSIVREADDSSLTGQHTLHQAAGTSAKEELVLDKAWRSVRGGREL